MTPEFWAAETIVRTTWSAWVTVERHAFAVSPRPFAPIGGPLDLHATVTMEAHYCPIQRFPQIRREAILAEIKCSFDSKPPADMHIRWNDDQPHAIIESLDPRAMRRLNAGPIYTAGFRWAYCDKCKIFYWEPA